MEEIEEDEKCRVYGLERRCKNAGPVCKDAGIAEFGTAIHKRELARFYLG